MKVRSVRAPSNVSSGRSSRFGVAQAELERETKPDRAPAGLGEHRFAVVHADDLAAGRDQARQRPCVVTGASAEVGNPAGRPAARAAASILRLHACTDAISLAMSTKRKRTSGRPRCSTRVKRSTVAGCVMASPAPSVSRKTISVTLGMRLGLLVAGRARGAGRPEPRQRARVPDQMANVGRARLGASARPARSPHGHDGQPLRQPPHQPAARGRRRCGRADRRGAGRRRE